MKIGQAVRVIARESGHRFAIGEIVYRTPAPGDDEYDLEFKNSSGKVCYMDDDEYEFVDLTEEDTPRHESIRDEAIALIERFISKNKIFQAAIDAVLRKR